MYDCEVIQEVKQFDDKSYNKKSDCNDYKHVFHSGLNDTQSSDDDSVLLSTSKDVIINKSLLAPILSRLCAVEESEKTSNILKESFDNYVANTNKKLSIADRKLENKGYFNLRVLDIIFILLLAILVVIMIYANHSNDSKLQLNATDEHNYVSIKQYENEIQKYEHELRIIKIELENTKQRQSMIEKAIKITPEKLLQFIEQNQMNESTDSVGTYSYTQLSFIAISIFIISTIFIIFTSIKEKLSNFESAVKDTNRKQVNTESELTKTKTEHESNKQVLNDRLDSIDLDINQITQHLAIIDEKNNKLNNSVSSLDQSLPSIKSKLSSIETSIDDTNTKLINTETELKDTNRKLGNTETKFAIITLLHESIKLEFNDRLNSINLAYDEITQRLVKIDEINNELSNSVSSLSRSIPQITSKLVGIETSIDDTNAKLVNTETVIERNKSDMEKSNIEIIALFNSIEYDLIINFESKFNELIKNPIPLGFIYIQLPRQPEPIELWPNFEWDVISGEYSGHFFRVEGGNAAEFGQSQCDAFQGHEHGSYSCNSSSNPSHTTLEVTYSYTDNTNELTSGIKSDGSNGEPRVANETRPINYSVRVWKRIN